jgi:dolichol-phosphate mannosyltransferase
MKLTLIIPAYNESEGVQQTADKLRPVLDGLRQKYEVEVLIIDDGSKDNTLDLLKTTFGNEPGVQIIPHGTNRGLGGALKTGFAHATGDIVVTTDFDGTYDFTNIPHLVDQLQRDNVDIVTASPYHPKGHVEGVPGYRLIFSQGASILYRVIVRWNVHTWTALFRAYRQPVIKNVTFESDSFLAGTQLLVYALRAGYKVSEYPTTLRTRTFGQSSLKIARVTWTHLKFISRIVWDRKSRVKPASP